MTVCAIWAVFVVALSCATTVVSQGTDYQFTMDVTSSPPIPGKPYTLTWTGGDSTSVVYIIFNYYFPDTPDQNIIYITTDILSNALNNGSWTYMVPIAIEPGRYSFSIGINPFLLSDTSAIFVFEPSQVSSVSPASVPIGTPSYNGCGLPPVPGYTYTGYQPPCTVTTNDQVKTLYPVVPASDSSSFFGSMAPETTTPTSIASPASIATDIYAQALQCPTPITPSPTTITASGATTIFSLVGCATALAASPSISNSSNVGVCHTSGYTTFSVSGASSVCCPDGWATTPLTADLFCFMTIRGTRAELFGQVSTETVETSPNTVVEISGLAFTRAGVVVNEVAAGSTSTSVVDSSTAITTTTTGAGASTTKKSGGGKLRLRVWETLTTVGMLSYLVL